MRPSVRGQLGSAAERRSERAAQMSRRSRRSWPGRLPRKRASKGALASGQRKGRCQRPVPIGFSCGVPEGVDPVAGKNGHGGADWRSVRRFPIALLGAVHAGGEQSCNSVHLEPFPFWADYSRPAMFATPERTAHRTSLRSKVSNGVSSGREPTCSASAKSIPFSAK